MKFAGGIAKWTFILSLPVLFLAASVAWGFNSSWIYEYGFNKYRVSEAAGLPPSELGKAARGMIAYFNSRDQFVQITVNKDGKPFELFSIQEQIHLRDVKQLVLFDYRALLTILILDLSYVLASILRRRGQYRRQLATAVIWGSGLTLAVIIVVGSAVVLGFDWLWEQFHFVAFTNDFWSVPGYMTLIFGAFWFDAILIAIGFMAGLALLAGGLSMTYLRFTKRGSTIKGDASLDQPFEKRRVLASTREP